MQRKQDDKILALEHFPRKIFKAGVREEKAGEHKMHRIRNLEDAGFKT